MVKERYNGIYLFKFIMSICVVAIHTEPLINNTNTLLKDVYSVFVNMAVPFFFLAAGFLLANKFEHRYNSLKNISTIKSYLFKIIKMYIFWNIIYLPLSIYEYIKIGMNPLDSFWFYIQYFIFVGEHYNSYILWYLLSTIYSLVMILILLRNRFSLKSICIIGFLILLLSFGIDAFMSYEDKLPSFLSIIKEAISYTIVSGRVLRGMFYLPLGMYLARRKIPNSINYLFLILGFIVNCFVKNSFVSEILLLISIIGLFSIVKSMKLKNSLVYPFLGKMSTVIYFIHLYIWTFYYKIIYNEKAFGIDCFVVTILCCIVISFAFVYFRNRKKTMFLC